MDPDPGGAGIEDRPTWRLRINYSLMLVRQRIMCHEEGVESGYESFQRVRTLSQSADSEGDIYGNSVISRIKRRVTDWVEKFRSGYRREDEGLLQHVDDGERNDQDEEEHHREEETVACCSFRKSPDVLDDMYTVQSQP